MNGRGWTPIESDPRWEDESYYDSVKARCDALAKWWSYLHNEDEQARWQTQRDYEDSTGYDPGEDAPRRRDYTNLFDSPEEAEAQYQHDLAQFEAQLQEWEDERKAVIAERQVQMEYCEEKLEQLGARMMRPYEHWNEDEGYMEYMERDR